MLELNFPTPVPVSGEELLRISQRSAKMLERIRDTMLQPFPRKQAPVFPSSRVQEICGIDKQRMAYQIKKGELPPGTQEKVRGVRKFTLADTIEWVKSEGKSPRRPTGQKGKVITVGNFKGGVTKTTTSMILAQGLSMRHARKVLIIDLDPQGSATTLHGINPHAEISADQTVLPLIEGTQSSLQFAIMKTYWDNLDLIPSATDLFNAEFILPSKVDQEIKGYEFWGVLREGIEPLLDTYDYVIIDTAPTLSYLTINALFASDSIIVPVVPDTLSFASMVQFWSLFADLVNGLQAHNKGGTTKAFDYISILITRMAQRPPAILCRDWILKTYGESVLPIVIPETDLARTTTTEFSTVYDMPNYDGSTEAYRRICDPYDQLIDLIDQKTCFLWSQQEEISRVAA